GQVRPAGEPPREDGGRPGGRPPPGALRRVLAGLELEDGRARFDSVEEAPDAEPDARHGTYRVRLHEGRNREVRRLWQAAGFEVSRLTRVRYGPVGLPEGLRPGGTAPVTGALLRELRAASGLEGTTGSPTHLAPAR